MSALGTVFDSIGWPIAVWEAKFVMTATFLAVPVVPLGAASLATL